MNVGIDVRSRAGNDKAVFFLLLLQVPILWVSGLFGAGLFVFSVVSSVILGVVAVICFTLLRGHWLTSVTFAVLMMSFSALLIQSQLGMIEMHFHIFAMMAIFLVYEDWRPILAALLTVAIHHIAFTVWQLAGVSVAGMPLMAFAVECSWGITLLHALFAGFEAIALSVLAEILRRRTQADQAVVKVVEEASSHQNLQVRSPYGATGPGRAINLWLGTLQETFSGLRQRAGHIDSLSHALDDISSSVGRLTAKQYDQTRRIAEATEEVLGSISSVEESSSHSAVLTDQLEKEVSAASQSMASIVEAIRELEKEIREASRSMNQVHEDTLAVSSIVDSITAISEQTNLLALNAAIEAARAGESGRGFAVVADEVRTLAARTKSSAGEIGDLIQHLNDSVRQTTASMERSQQEMEHSSGAVMGVGDKLAVIATESQQVKNVSQSIAQALEEQRRMMEQIGGSSTEINTDGRELAKISEELVRRASELRDMVADNRAAIGRYQV